MNYKEADSIGKLFQAVSDEWWSYHSENIEHNTIKQYKPALREINARFLNVPIKNIQSRDIDSFIRSIAIQGYAQKTVKTRLLVLNLIFKYAVINQYVSANPCQYITVPKNLKKEKRELPSEAEIKTVKESYNLTFGLFAYLILYTGLRRGEALALTYDDIDYENKEIHVTKSVYYVGNVPYIKTPKTEAGYRDVVLLDCLAEKLSAKQKNSLPNENLIFPDQNGELIRNGHFTRLWDKYREESGLHITPHQLRHAYATILYEAGIDVKDAQELMGHTTIQVTRDIYTHISKNQKKKTADKLNAFVSQK